MLYGTNAIAEFHVCCVPNADNHSGYVKKVEAAGWQLWRRESSNTINYFLLDNAFVNLL